MQNYATHAGLKEMEPRKPTGFSCHSCLSGPSCPMAGMDECPEEDLGRMPSGPKLVFSSIAVFLLPLLTGILGAYVVGRYAAKPEDLGWWQICGLIAGALVGIVIAKGLIALMGFRRDDKEKDTTERS